MRQSDLEFKVLQIADQVDKRQYIEGSDTELKSEWPTDLPKSARQIAGHCNAARGEAVLWIIGLDETRGVVGATPEELANWWPAVQKEFDRESPELAISMSVAWKDKTLYALYFLTTRAPFVTKIRSGTGSAELEVPWREGNKTRSSHREDLIRLLVPVTNTPALEIRYVHARYYQASINKNWAVVLNAKFYATIRSTVILPAHRCFLTIKPEHLDRDKWGAETSVGLAKDFSPDDICLERSGAFQVRFRGTAHAIGPYLPSPLKCRIELHFLDAIAPAVLEFDVHQSQISPNLDWVDYELRK